MLSPRPSKGDERTNKGTLDPILTLQTVPSNGVKNTASGITSICFINHDSSLATRHDYEQRAQSDVGSDTKLNSDDDESDTSEEIANHSYRCRRLVAGEKSHDDDPTSHARNVAASLSLRGRFMATCQANGENHVWDLGQRKIVGLLTENRGPGLALRRLHQCNTRFFYQTRESRGTVSLHDASRPSSSVITRLETGSQTFCAASPCVGNSNLVALPSSETSFAIVRDWRASPSNHPVAHFHGAEGINLDHMTADDSRKHGMVTSLAMIESNDTSVILCGMESGTLFLHDLAMQRQSVAIVNPCNIQTSSTQDPILSLDVASSPVPRTFVVVAGMAGNSEDVALLPKPEQGRVAVIKGSNQNGNLQARLRTRLDTCTVEGSLNDTMGKPGVALCRFRPDGRIFAVGGWDKRLRIFDRSTSAKTTTPLAILRGHVESVNAMDWSPDAASSGLLATGSSDGRVYVWRCFSSTMES